MEQDEPLDAAAVIRFDLSIVQGEKQIAYVRNNRLWLVMPEADLEVTGGPVMPEARPALIEFITQLGRATGLERYGDLLRRALEALDATPAE